MRPGDFKRSVSGGGGGVGGRDGWRRGNGGSDNRDRNECGQVIATYMSGGA